MILKNSRVNSVSNVKQLLQLQELAIRHPNWQKPVV